MDVWRELVRAALFGSERGQLSPALRRELADRGIDPGLPAPQLLLEGAAVFHLLSKAAAALQHFSGAIPAPPPDAWDEAAAGPQSAYHLQLILEGPYLPALEEYVGCLSGRHKVLPTDSLPALLDRCSEDDHLWQALRPIIGETGRWLISLNPQWRRLSPDPDPQFWIRGGREDRLALLRALRGVKPAEARQLLAENWEELNFRERAACLETLRPHLSLDDEAFLSAGLADSRKEVRRAAAGLLLLLPDSALSTRLFTWAATFITNAGGSLSITLPDGPAAEFVDYGLTEKTAPAGRVSLRTNWLSQVLAGLAPVLWEKHLGLTPLKILQGAARQDQGPTLIRAWTEAALRHEDHRWMGALLAIWEEDRSENFQQEKTARQLMEKMPDQLVNRFVVNQLERNGPLVAENSLAGQLLLLGKHRWSDQLTLIIVKGFQHWLSEITAYSWNSWHYKQLLEVAAFRCNPKLITSLRKDWNTQSPVWPRWEEEVDRFLEILQFRKEMRESIERD